MPVTAKEDQEYAFIGTETVIVARVVTVIVQVRRHVVALGEIKNVFAPGEHT